MVAVLPARHRNVPEWSLSKNNRVKGRQMKDTVIGVDLAKTIFQVHGASRAGEVMFRKKLRRQQVYAVHGHAAACSGRS